MVGLALTLAATQVMGAMLYGVNCDPATYGDVHAGLAVALAASYVLAERAARTIAKGTRHDWPRTSVLGFPRPSAGDGPARSASDHELSTADTQAAHRAARGPGADRATTSETCGHATDFMRAPAGSRRSVNSFPLSSAPCYRRREVTAIGATPCAALHDR
jgi:hypothetical protein